MALLVDANRRISSLRAIRGCTFHEVRLGPFDVVSLGGLMVSSPLRTAVDIALHVDAERARAGPGSPPWPRRSWTCGCGCSVRAVEATPRMPHKRSALAKLAALRPEQDGGRYPQRCV